MKKVLGLFAILAVLAIVGVAVAGSMLWGRLHEPYKGYDGAEQFVQIPPGSGAAEIRRRLVDARVVRDEFTLRAALRWTGSGRDLKAGEYRFDQPMSAVDVVDKLSRGEVYGHRITFPEGLTIAEMARI